MKNVTKLPPRQIMGFSIEGFRPLRGWALKLVSDIGYVPIKPGYWLAVWTPMRQRVEFAFSAKVEIAFTTEEAAKLVSDELLRNTEIQTEVVHVG